MDIRFKKVSRFYTGFDVLISAQNYFDKLLNYLVFIVYYTNILKVYVHFIHPVCIELFITVGFL